MPKFILSLVVLLLALTACSPVAMVAPTPTGTNHDKVPAAETESIQPTQAAIGIQETEPVLTPTSPQEPPAIPTDATQALPTVFDQAGYRQFAIVRSMFPGLIDYLGERANMESRRSLSPNGNLLAVAGCWGSMDNFLNCETENSGFLVVMDVNSGDLVADIPLNGGWPYAVDFSADSQQVLYSTKQQQVVLWDIAAQKPASMLNSQQRSTSRSYPSVAALPDGSGFASVIAKKLYVWDESGNLLAELPTQQSATTTYMAYSLDGSRLGAYTTGGTVVEVFDTTQWTLSNRIASTGVRSIAFSPDGQILAVLDSNGNSINTWDMATGGQLGQVNLENPGSSLSFNPAGDMLIISGPGDLDTEDGYSAIATLVDTQTWQPLDTLYSFSDHGPIAFNTTGERMAIFGPAITTVWGMPDETLLAGLDVAQQFQGALANSDFATAASLFDPTVYGAEYFSGIGIDVDDMAGSFAQLCATGEVFCQPVKEPVMMGYDWYDLVYLMHLEEGDDGGVFTSPAGAQVIYLTLKVDATGKLRVTFPAMDY